MSIGKCSIGVIRRCFFFKPRPLNFPGRRRLEFSSISIGESCFFAEVGKCFPFRAKENMPVSAETQLRLSSNEKIQATYILNFYGNNEQKTTLYRKNIYCRPAFVKKIAQCRLKNISRGYLTTDVGDGFFYSIPEKYLADVYLEMFDRRHPVMILF